MKTFFNLWKTAVIAAGYRSLNAFLVAHDPSGSAYQSTTKNLTGMPGPERIARWIEILKLPPDQGRELLAAADRDRVKVAGDGKQLGAGIRANMAEMEILKAQLAEAVKERDRIKAILLQISDEFARLNIKRPELLAQMER